MKVDIENIKRKLLVKYPLFGSVVANTNYIEDEKCYLNNHPTAGTDGINIYYHPDFLKNLNENEQIFVFAHEISHIAFDHINRREGKIPEIWNLATDAVINAFLKRDGLQLAKGVVDIPEAINYDADTMYEKLLKERQDSNQSQSGESNQQENNQDSAKSQNNESNNNGNEQTNSSNKDVGHDTHSMWGKKINNSETKNENNVDNKETNNDEKKQDIDKISKMGEKQAFNQNKIEKKQQLEKLKQELINKSCVAGNDTNSSKRDTKDIGTASQLIDWRRLLKDAIQLDVDWSYKNAEIEYGVVLSRLEEIYKPETEILLDTSGSISKDLLKTFLRECKTILECSKVKVGCFDTKFYGFKEIKSIDDIDDIEYLGGGGTNFDVAVNSFTKRVENKIIFTDGYAQMPDKKIYVIWVVFGEREINPKYGKVIHISREQLNNLKIKALIKK